MRLDLAFACYHFVYSTCQFSHFGKLPEQSGKESRVRAVRKQIGASPLFINPLTQKVMRKITYHSKSLHDLANKEAWLFLYIFFLSLKPYQIL